MSLTAILALSLVSVAAFAGYRNERIGSAILVGCGALAAFYLLVGVQADERQAPQTPSAPTTLVTTPGTLGGEPPRSDGQPRSLPSTP